MSEEKVKRVPVNYQWQALNWDFLRLLADIASYAAGKYGSAEQYVNARLEGEKSPVNHMYEHLRAFQAGELHDHFGTLEHQLAAVAYNAMIEYAYVRMYGHAPNKVMAASTRRGNPLPSVESLIARVAPAITIVAADIADRYLEKQSADAEPDED